MKWITIYHFIMRGILNAGTTRIERNINAILNCLYLPPFGPECVELELFCIALTTFAPDLRTNWFSEKVMVLNGDLQFNNTNSIFGSQHVNSGCVHVNNLQLVLLTVFAKSSDNEVTSFSLYGMPTTSRLFHMLLFDSY
jgi:hypothetical protein